MRRWQGAIIFYNYPQSAISIVSLQFRRRTAYGLAVVCLTMAGFSTTITGARPVLSQPALESTTLERDRLYEDGVRLQDAGQYHEAIDTLKRALQTFTGAGDTLSEGDRQRQAAILNQIGNVYLALEEYSLASEYYAQAIEVRQAEPIAARSESGPQANASSRAAPSINFQIPDVAATSVASSGGSRGAILPSYELVALLPETNFGFTAADYPKVFVSVAEPLDEVPVELVVTGSEDDFLAPIYQITRSLTLPTPGIFGVDFSALEGMVPLEVGTRYRWQLTLVTNPNRPAQNAIAAGEIERVRAIALESESNSVGAVYAYAEAGLWYDAIATLYELERQGEAPEGLWPEMLQLAELDDLLEAPLLGDWSGLLVAEMSEGLTVPREDGSQRTTFGSGGTPGSFSYSTPDMGPPNPTPPGGSR